jgi:hypothetical protein
MNRTHENERSYGPSAGTSRIRANLPGKTPAAAQVILEAARDLTVVPDPLEVELGIFKDRVEFALLLPEAAVSALPQHDGHDAVPRA